MDQLASPSNPPGNFRRRHKITLVYSKDVGNDASVSNISVKQIPFSTFFGRSSMVCPAHVTCGWIGNSEAVARKQYLQITDAYFEKQSRKKVAQSDCV